jgi:hypothetical protein
MVIILLAYLSSKSYGLDRVAAKYVALSFRFVTCAVLGAVFIVLEILSVHPTRAAASAVLILLFLTCSLLDCSPHTPASSQIFITVPAFAPDVQLVILHLTNVAVVMVDNVWALGC